MLGDVTTLAHERLFGLVELDADVSLAIVDLPLPGKARY